MCSKVLSYHGYRAIYNVYKSGAGFVFGLVFCFSWLQNVIFCVALGKSPVYNVIKIAKFRGKMFQGLLHLTLCVWFSLPSTDPSSLVGFLCMCDHLNGSDPCVIGLLEDFWA